MYTNIALASTNTTPTDLNNLALSFFTSVKINVALHLWALKPKQGIVTFSLWLIPFSNQLADHFLESRHSLHHSSGPGWIGWYEWQGFVKQHNLTLGTRTLTRLSVRPTPQSDPQNSSGVEFQFRLPTLSNSSDCKRQISRRHLLAGSGVDHLSQWRKPFSDSLY